MTSIVTKPEELTFSLPDLHTMPAPGRVLLVDPAYFDVEYVINPHMQDHVGNVDKTAARAQWEALRKAYERLGIDVHVLPGAEGLPDMVFSANQSLPCLVSADGSAGGSGGGFAGDSGAGFAGDSNKFRRTVVMSIMNASQRKAEVPYFEQYYRSIGYEILHLDAERTACFEGMGDALWHPGRAMLWGAYGFRSDLSAYEQITAMLGVPVIALELKDPSFYHLDTCLCILNEQTALIYPSAFTAEGLALIHALFDVVIEAPQGDALRRFAVNAVCPDGHHVLIQRGCDATNKALQHHGFEVMEFDTEEYIKSGGSVFCMKMLYW